MHRLAPATGRRLLVVGGGIGTRLVEAAMIEGLDVANMDMPASLAQRPSLPGEWQLPCEVASGDDGARAFAERAESFVQQPVQPSKASVKLIFRFSCM